MPTPINGAAEAHEVRAAVPLPLPRVIPPVAILLDRERHMIMDFAAMEKFEEVTGLSAWGRDAWDGNPRHVAALIWAALLAEDPDLTLDAVKRMPQMSLANMAYLSDRLGELWGTTMPEADGVPGTETETEASDDPNPRRRAG